MRIAFCLPMRDGRLFAKTAACFARDCLNLKGKGHLIELAPVEGLSLISYVRNEAVWVARNMGADLIIQIDDDTEWDAEVLPRIVANMEAHEDLRFVAVAIPYKAPGPLKWNVFWPDGEETITWHEPTNYIAVDKIGGAFTVIRASVFDEMEEYLVAKDPSYRHTVTGQEMLAPRVAFYENPRSWGEDTWFCKTYREMGGTIWVDYEAEVRHLIAPNWDVGGKLGDLLREKLPNEARLHAPSVLAEPVDGRDQLKVTILVPTRGRPELAKRAIESIFATAYDPDLVKVVLGVDDDDETVDVLRKLYADTPQIEFLCGPREPTIGSIINKLWMHATGHIVGQIVDECVFVTKDWDRILRHSVQEGGIYNACVTGIPQGLVPAPFMTLCMRDKFREAVGFVNPPIFPFWFGDVWFADIAIAASCFKPLPMQIDVPEDQRAVVRDLGFWANVYKTMAPMVAKVAAKLLGCEDDPNKLHRLEVVARSLHGRIAPMDHASVQEHFEAKDAPPPRYFAAKDAAERFLADINEKDAA